MTDKHYTDNRIQKRVLIGLQEIWDIRSPYRELTLLLFAGAFLIHAWMAAHSSTLSPILPIISSIALFLSIAIVTAYGFSSPLKAMTYEERLKRAGICNHRNQPPLFIREWTEDGGISHHYLFDSVGIPLKKWEDKKTEIESAINLNIDSIEKGRSAKLIHMVAVGGDVELPQFIYWNSRCEQLPDYDFTLGETKSGTMVLVDIRIHPHFLLGGSTGSGKSELLKILCYQCILRGYDVYLADFKGGVDFSEFWHKNCAFIDSMDELKSSLYRDFIVELQNRKGLLRDAKCKIIDFYNEKGYTPLKRRFFICDEIGELLDDTGASKEDKESIHKMIGYLSTISRQGRAFGLHLILATQRPDANVLPGQIKNNITCRIAGRCDDVLSRIILDNTDASDRIDKNKPGYFINLEGTLFKGYILDEK